MGKVALFKSFFDLNHTKSHFFWENFKLIFPWNLFLRYNGQNLGKRIAKLRLSFNGTIWVVNALSA
jgi:hypothetical protein